MITIPSFPLKKKKRCIFCNIDLYKNASKHVFVYASIICFPCYDEMNMMPIGPEYIYKIIKSKKGKIYKDFSVITIDDKSAILLFPMATHIKHNGE